MLSSATRFSLVSAVVLMLAGCSGANEGDDQTDDSAITATQANERQHALKEHVLKGVPASSENQKELGIATWDVFAGADTAKGFSGALFYASDADNDVRYAFAVDSVTHEAAIVVLSKDGLQLKDAKVSAETYSKLLNDVVMLKKKIDALSHEITVGSAISGGFACAVTIAVGALGVIAAGAAVAAGAAGMVWVVGTTFSAGANEGLLALAFFLGGTVGIGYTEWLVLPKVLAPVIAVPAKCVEAIRG